MVLIDPVVLEFSRETELVESISILYQSLIFNQ